MDLQQIKALIFVLFAIGVATAIRPRFDHDTVSVRIIAYWILAAIIGFLMPIDSAKIIMLGILMAALTPSRFEDRPAYFMCIFFALPMNVYWVVPFPGVNFLFRLDHGLLACFIVGIPLMIAGMSRQKDPDRHKTPMADTLFIGMSLLIAILNARNTTFTNSARYFLVDMVMYIVPYFAITRSLISREALQSLLRGALTVGILICFIALLTVLQNWNHYDLTGNDVGFATTVYRTGSARVNLTVGHTLAGVLLTAGFMAIWYAARHTQKMRSMTYPLLFMTFIGILGTQSRGAYLAFMISICTIILLRFRSWPTRIGLGSLGMIAMVVLFIGFRNSGFEKIDQYGTFSYRNDLLRVGIDYISVHPWFGSTDFSDAPQFEPLRQGQGIIDFVNGYLQYVLRWGLVGLSLIVFTIVNTIFGAIRAMDRISGKTEPRHFAKAFGLGYIALFTGLLISLMTTSDVSYYPLVLVFLLAIGQGYRKISYLSFQSSNQHKLPEDTTPPDKPFAYNVTPGSKSVWS